VLFRSPTVNYRCGRFFQAAAPLLTYLKRRFPEYYEGYYNYVYKGDQLPACLFERANEIIDGEVAQALANTGLQVINIRTKMLGISLPRRPHSKCRASPWYLFVGPDATVYNCVELGLDPRAAIGNLLTQSLADIWADQRRQNVMDFIDHEGLDTLCPPICLYYELNNLFERLDRALQAGDKPRAAMMEWMARQEACVEAEMASGHFSQAHREFV
jgi:radical SAM protein with 4Fe4S-binding SPASM domain